MSRTKIEWTESTWNPTTGCTKISTGCKNCYAERMCKRLKLMGQSSYLNEFRITCHPTKLKIPLSWKKSKMIFVNSMSDLFHEDIPTEFINKVFKTMREAKQHQFQILTKRTKRLVKIAPKIKWPSNVWMGVTVENADYLSRIDDLRTVPAAIRFLSLEPLLGAIPNIDLGGIDWVITGGESGIGARMMEPDWVSDIRDQCLKAKVPFFFKQWGGKNKKITGRKLDGRVWSQMPRQ